MKSKSYLIGIETTNLPSDEDNNRVLNSAKDVNAAELHELNANDEVPVDAGKHADAYAQIAADGPPMTDHEHFDEHQK